MFSEEMICSLNDLELEVYKYVVRNADKVCYMRIREFADAAHVSTSTILRILLRPARMWKINRILFRNDLFDLACSVHQKQLHRRCSKIYSNIKHVRSSFS